MATATSTNSSIDANSSTTATNAYGNANPSSDPFAVGPSFYLYGFLAALSLIFLVSVAVAWKGYHTRRALRARLDEAMTRGVYIPGQTGADYLTIDGGAQGHSQHLTTPIMYHNWLDTTLQDKNDIIVANTGWDIKPTAIAAICPYTPPSPRSIPPRHPSTLLHDLFETIRGHWFTRAVEGSALDQQSQTDSRPTNSGAPRTTTTGNDSEKELNLSNALGLSVAVLIVMPNAMNPTSHRRAMNGKGKSVSRPNSFFSGNSRSLLAHVPAQRVASTSSPRESVTIGGVEEVHEKDELPEIIMGVAEVALWRPVEPSLSEENGERVDSLAIGTKAKVKSTPTPSERIQSTSAPRLGSPLPDHPLPPA